MVLWICYIFCWEINDDIVMVMVVYGFGLVVEVFVNIIFFNVLWGYLVSLLLIIGGVFGYLIGMVVVLFISGLGIFFYLCRLSVVWFLVVGLIVLILLWFVIFL